MNDSPPSPGHPDSNNDSDSGSDGSDDNTIFGTGAYHNIRRGITLCTIGEDFQGLFAEQAFPAGTILWKNRVDGPAEAQYRKIFVDDLQTLSADELRFFIRYSYQQNEELFISPLCAREVDLDFSNYW